jgi:hypothetical protein
MFRIHGLFRPDVKSLQSFDPIHELWSEVQEHLDQEAERQLACEEKEWEELSEALDKLTPLVSSALQSEGETDAIREDASDLVPDKELRKKAYDWYVENLNRKPEEAEQRKAELETAKQNAAISQCRDKIHESLACLYEMIGNQTPGAAKALVDVATHASFYVSLATSAHPETMKEVAAMNTLWPTVAAEDPGWEKSALDEIANLELGKGVAKFKSSLRNVRGSDVNLPARRWAKAAVRTIDETRWRAPLFFHFVNKLGGSMQWASFSINRGWDIEDYPSWAISATRLEPFSLQTYDSWKAVVRDIIREQVPDFHLRPEWATQRATAAANGRDTPGEIQNAILDDIVSSLKRLAPEAPC